MHRLRLIAPALAASLLAGCHVTRSELRPGAQVVASRGIDPAAVELLERAPDAGTYEEVADVSFESTGMDKLSRAEAGLRQEAVKLGADAVIVENLRIIRTIGATTNMYGVAIRRR